MKLEIWNRYQMLRTILICNFCTDYESRYYFEKRNKIQARWGMNFVEVEAQLTYWSTESVGINDVKKPCDVIVSRYGLLICDVKNHVT